MNRMTTQGSISSTNAVSGTETLTLPVPSLAQEARARLLAEMIQKYDVNQDGVLNAQERAKAEAETGLDMSSLPVDVIAQQAMAAQHTQARAHHLGDGDPSTPAVGNDAQTRS